MNQKNLSAIETSLLNITPRGRLSADEIHVMALAMANAGVLVPSSLTDEEAALLGSLWPDNTVPVLGSAVKAQLEWLAKGDPDARMSPAKAGSSDDMQGDPEGTSILRPPKTSDPS